MVAAKAMDIAFIIINLDRSQDRWISITENIGRLDIVATRLSAIDGVAVDRRDWVDFDEAAFRRKNGRIALLGEYGCYRSHLAALDLAISSDAPYTVILEDDVELDKQQLARIKAIVELVPEFDVIKLHNHRINWFVAATGGTEYGDRIGRTVHGPLGSAAAYIVTRLGAKRLREKLRIMERAWDVALERYWATGIDFYTVERNVVTLSHFSKKSTIDLENSYKSAKFSFYRRISTYKYKANEIIMRGIHLMLWLYKHK